jgi:hypothetical protein
VSTTAPFVRFALFAEVDTSLTIPMTNAGAGAATYYVGADNDPTDLAVDANAGQPVAVLPERSDGIEIPINSKVVSVSSGSASGTLISAPGAGNSILLGGCMLRFGTIDGTGEVAASVLGTFSASSETIASIGGQTAGPGFANQDRADWPTGPLCDVNTAVTFTTVTAGGATLGSALFIVYYDIVNP